MELRIAGLSKTYENGVKALDDVSLTIGPGLYGLLGPNGAGKSTLMRILATLLDADEGSAFLGDIDMLRSKLEVRRLLGYLPQEFGVYPRISAAGMLDHIAILSVRNEQFHIRYNKGGMALYELRQMIGEDAMNRALRRLLSQYGYAPPPYALVGALRDETPEQYRCLIGDLFEDITLFNNHTQSAQARRLADGKYEVTVKCQFQKLKTDNDGRQSEVPLDDWVEVGAFGKAGKLLHRKRVHVASPGNETKVS